MRTLRLSIPARRPGRSVAMPLGRRTLARPRCAANRQTPVGLRRPAGETSHRPQAAAAAPCKPPRATRRRPPRPGRLARRAHPLGARRRGFQRRTGSGACPVPGRSAGAARRRRIEFELEAADRDAAPWTATLPEAVLPFLAVRQTVLQCPTCKARQVPSLECRRCKCDLTLVAAVHAQQRRLHARVLRQLADGDVPAALQAARARWALAPDAAAARLLGVCLLLLDRFPAAQDVYDRGPAAE